MRRAELAIQGHAQKAQRRRPLKLGALLLRAGILEAPGTYTVQTLPPVAFSADIKDASLAPLRDRLISLSRDMREAGQANSAAIVGKAIHILSTFASLPFGISEARQAASILFDGDGRNEVEARTSFFPTSALQQMAEVEAAVPAFAVDIRRLLNEIRAHVNEWEQATPVSLKLAQLLGYPEWNAPDVLLVLPDPRTVDMFLVSDCGVNCACTVIDVSQLAEQTNTTEWRRIIILRPEPKALRVLLTMPATPSRVLLLGDTAGISLIAAELRVIVSLPDFAPFAARAAAMSTALLEGGASELMSLADVELQYRTPSIEGTIDFTQAADGYTGEVIRFRLEGGGRATYRPGGDVLVFTGDEVRPFRRVPARSVANGDEILVLHKELRDRLSEALSRSRKTIAQLKIYHRTVAQFRQRLPVGSMTAKARRALMEMRAIDPSIGEHEVPNIIRWLSVEPSDSPQQPRAARDYRRFSAFMKAAGVEKSLADVFWNCAIVPARAYSTEEGHLFNRRIIQFVIDPEGVAAGAGWREYDGLWQVVAESVDRVISKEILYG